MITSITLENFKSFRKVEVNPRLITAFVGPNGSGKSSVLQALALLKQSAGGDQIRLNLRGPLVNLRTYAQLQPNFDADIQEVHLGFGGTHKFRPSSTSGFGSSADFSYDAEFLNGNLAS